MIEKILNGNDRAHELGSANYERMLREPPVGLGWKSWAGEVADVVGVRAYINGGRWLAACPDCAGTFYVTPAMPVHFCPGCGNAEIGGKAAPVLFPDDWQVIEQALLARPQWEQNQRSASQRSAAAMPLAGGLRRDWVPGQTLSELLAENAEAGL